ncbi:MAG: DUF4129 domain-containing protein [Halobacteriales archaeon]
MRDSIRSAAIAVLVIVAVAVVAATIESTVVPEEGGSGGSGGGATPGGGGILPAGNATAPGETLQIPFLTEITVVLGVLVVLAFLAYLYAYRRAALKVFVALAVVIGLLYVIFSVLGFPPESPMEPTRGLGNGSPFGGGGGDGGGGIDSGAAEQPSLPSILLLLGLIAALFGTVLAYLRTASDGDDRTQADESDGVDATAVGAAAGRAADRLERDASADNEVYRAWREMTALLDIPDPQTSTPGDFETAAIEAGMGRNDVRELTRLFEDVRYGDADPSTERERRAIDVFRRIEARYTEDDP